MPKSKRKGKPRAPAKLNEKTIVCSHSGCGKSFSRPIEVRVTGSGDVPEIYDACPHCFSKVTYHNQVPKSTGETSPAVVASDKDVDKEKDKRVKSKPSGCPHSFGYLSDRPKGASIPDSCLMCPEITKCMLQ